MLKNLSLKQILALVKAFFFILSLLGFLSNYNFFLPIVYRFVLKF